MSTSTEEKTAIERYLDAVRAELADLPADERVDLLEDVEQHLLEVAAEGDEPLETRLGPPAEYAAELRVAAGLPSRASADDPFAQRLAARISQSRAARLSRRLQLAAANSPGAAEALKFVRSLQPAWWLARAYIATVVLGMLTNGAGWRVSLFPRVFGSRLAGLLALVVLTAGSVAWARVTRVNRTALALTIVANTILLITGFNLVNERLTRSAYADGDAYAARGDTSVVRGPFGNILNIYPYSADGKPLKDVLLYDQDGNPIPGVVMDEYTLQRGARGPNGEFIPNLFPYAEAVRDARTGEIVGERRPPDFSQLPKPARSLPSEQLPSPAAAPPTPSAASAAAAPSSAAAPPTPSAAPASATPSAVIPTESAAPAPTTTPTPTAAASASPPTTPSPESIDRSR